jgi:hypothetical protein
LQSYGKLAFHLTYKTKEEARRNAILWAYKLFNDACKFLNTRALVEDCTRPCHPKLYENFSEIFTNAGILESLIPEINERLLALQTKEKP